jgi:Tfp pilus assembly protein PilW
MARSLSSQKGFTLIELLLYSAMVGSLLTGVVLFFTTSVDSRIKTQSISEVNQQGAATMEYLTAAIRNATSITAPTNGTSAASLTLVVPTGSLSPTVFDLGGSALEVKEGAAAVVPLTNSKVQITSLTFTNLSRTGTPGVVQVSFVISRVNPGNRNEFDYQKTFTSSAALRWP